MHLGFTVICPCMSYLSMPRQVRSRAKARLKIIKTANKLDNRQRQELSRLLVKLATSIRGTAKKIYRVKIGDKQFRVVVYRRAELRGDLLRVTLDVDIYDVELQEREYREYMQWFRQKQHELSARARELILRLISRISGQVAGIYYTAELEKQRRKLVPISRRYGLTLYRKSVSADLVIRILSAIAKVV